MRRKPTFFTSSGSVKPQQARGNMQISSRALLVAFFFIAYVIFTLHLAGIEHSCPTFEELAQQEENKPFVQSIERMARSANAAILLDEDINAPLAKLGIRIPIAEPPLDTANASIGVNRVVLPTPIPTYFSNENAPQHQLLQSNFAPNNAFYIWCGKRWFEFHHYLSVLSVIREMRPDNIIFFYDHYPVVDSWSYNTWFEELRDNYPFFRLWLMDLKEQPCDGIGKVNQTFLSNLLTYRGGMYVHENTIISKFSQLNRNYTIVNALDPQTHKGFVLTKRGSPGRFVKFEHAMAKPGFHTHTMYCSSMDDYIQAHRKPPCVITDKVFYPKDIWELENSFGQLARRVFYGDPEIRKPQRSYDELIPNIAHIVWIGGGEMDYLFYLCVLSLIYVAEVDKVYIHGDAPPSGKFWAKVRDNEKLAWIYRDSPGTIYGTKVDVISHVSDIWRVDFMVRYGGIYVDTDTVFVKPLDRDIRAYDAVGSYDWTDWNPPFPDTINFGVAIGKRNAKYWRDFQKSMKWFMDKDWSWNGLRQPYRIKERHPESVLIDPHLQVICFEAKCHPTWWPGYHNEQIHHLNSESIKNWRNDTYAFHWTLPTPFELLNEDNLLKSNSIFAEIGQYVLRKAGILN